MKDNGKLLVERQKEITRVGKGNYRKFNKESLLY